MKLNRTQIAIAVGTLLSIGSLVGVAYWAGQLKTKAELYDAGVHLSTTESVPVDVAALTPIEPPPASTPVPAPAPAPEAGFGPARPASTAIPLSVPSKATTKTAEALRFESLDDPALLTAARELVAEITHSGAEVDSLFQGPAGLTGLVMRTGGGHGIGWMTTDRKHLVIGALLDGTASNLSNAAFRQLFPQEVSTLPAEDALPAQPVDAATLMKAVLPLEGFTLGQGDRTLYVFADVNCPACAKMHRTVLDNADELKRRGIQVRWVIVSILGEKSTQQGAALLSLPETERAAALEEHHSHRHPLSQTIKIYEPNAMTALRTSYDTLAAISGKPLSTPSLVWWDTEKRVGLYKGVPQNLQELTKVLDRVAPFETAVTPSADDTPAAPARPAQP